MSLAQLSQLLPLPEEDLQQVLQYASTLSKSEAAAHFNNLLGDSPLAVDFISSFNSHRKEPRNVPASSPTGPSASASETIEGVPKTKRGGPKKKKPALHVPEARRVDEYEGPASKAYKKDLNLDYMPQRSSAPSSSQASRSTTPPVQQPQHQQPKQHASSAGFLISDIPSKAKAKSNPGSRSSTPKPSSGSSGTKVSISGGTPMAGQSTAMADLDAAIRALEITTNPTLENGKRKKCNCVAARHPLQGAAPNCLSCGKVICMREGLGPCTFCGTPLLSSDDVQAMVRELKDERGREKMAANAASHRRAEVSKKPAPFTQARGGDAGDDANSSLSEAATKAREHRDKLLNFQAQNAKRTTVRDEAADFDVTGAMNGTGNMWASPEERAKELKRQQKLLREMEWNARPDYEKRQQVVSIDLVGGKVIRKMAAVERPQFPDDDDDSEDSHNVLAETSGNSAIGSHRPGGGAFSGNPLLGSLMRPVFEVKGKGKDAGAPRSREERKKGWRRVQDDLDNNEDVILDGGVYGHTEDRAKGDEPECG